MTIKQFIKDNPFGVLAVVGDDGAPHTSAMYFFPTMEDDKLEL